MRSTIPSAEHQPQGGAHPLRFTEHEPQDTEPPNGNAPTSRGSAIPSGMDQPQGGAPSQRETTLHPDSLSARPCARSLRHRTLIPDQAVETRLPPALSDSGVEHWLLSLCCVPGDSTSQASKLCDGQGTTLLNGHRCTPPSAQYPSTDCEGLGTGSVPQVDMDTLVISGEPGPRTHRTRESRPQSGPYKVVEPGETVMRLLPATWSLTCYLYIKDCR